ncbi:DUF4604 domain-containing protein [Aspergillus clavatus NRRL 1]|uniref:DUF4604 domain-containing protein n=1 Tax=Aspergillus clavatus (strain ATCC 1007 / CBS 513.65 / DSM 816 / NCTC 3887 / NRRL 1 / QM 1276 / 107) TaxID=344612 RepID=A1CBT6_ASPCL|nr:uncharacterized protein ACLA_016500 [Aspergillus clavatus NRRL 1]EAW13204.1 hypothetical protein ACLA_016500 [Aspergillus clavatus NRRL 1]
MAFNAKNLAYENKQPAFLQRLRNQYGDTSGRLERPVARPRLTKTDDDDDDEPTYVFEESNEAITKEEFEALLSGDTDKHDSTTKFSSGQDQSTPASDKVGQQETEKPDPGDPSASKQNLAEIGGPKKRKQAKIIADESAEPETGAPQEKSGTQKVKQKQKKKKIKLSFDD